MRTLILLLLLVLTPLSSVFAGFGATFSLNETDNPTNAFYVPFDLRDRESFVQVTNQFSTGVTVHVQIYNVASLCNENNFFDDLTPNDTHTYNLRDILTNDGNPSGVVLPGDAYGIVYITAAQTGGGEIPFPFNPIFGNFRIIDNSGYEYRSNAQGLITSRLRIGPSGSTTFNFNSNEGVVLSDVFGIPLSTDDSQNPIFFSEASLDKILETFAAVDVDIIDNNEVLFSCRDVIFACVDENSPLLDELIVEASQEIVRSSASVANFEYGINNAIPHSKGGELLCPGNIINEGVVSLTFESAGSDTFLFAGYIGLNNGNGRASMDAFLAPNNYLFPF